MTGDLMPGVADHLLVLSMEEIRELERPSENGARLDAQLRDAAELCAQAQIALASSLMAEHPRTLTSVVLARYRRRWRWRLMFWCIFVPLGVSVLALFGSTVAALVTAFLWRP